MTTQVIGETPLVVLVGSAEEKVRQLAEHLESRGVLDGDPGMAALLAEVRIRLLAVTARLETE